MGVKMICSDSSSSSLGELRNVFDSTLYRLFSQRDGLKFLRYPERVRTEFDTFIQYGDKITEGIPSNSNLDSSDYYLGILGLETPILEESDKVTLYKKLSNRVDMMYLSYPQSIDTIFEAFIEFGYNTTEGLPVNQDLTELNEWLGVLGIDKEVSDELYLDLEFGMDLMIENKICEV